MKLPADRMAALPPILTQMFRSNRIVPLCALLFVAASAGAAGAETSQNSAPTVVTGTVAAAPDGPRLPGCVVSIATAAGEKIATAATGDDGRYRVTVDRTGTLQVTIACAGFTPDVRTVQIGTGTTTTIDAAVTIATVSQTIEVTPKTAVTLNLAEPLSSPFEILDRHWLTESPLASRGVEDALRMLPSVTPYGREWAIKGGRPNQATAQVDEAQAIDPASGAALLMAPSAAADRIQVLASPYSTEFGRFSTGTILVSSRAGGSTWSAGADSFLPAFRIKRSHPFDVLGIESVTPNLTLTGPLKSNKLFLAESAQLRYQVRDITSRPQDQVSIRKAATSFTRLDAILGPRHVLTATLGLAPARIDNATLGTFDPPDAAADLGQRAYRTGVVDSLSLPHGWTLVTNVQFSHVRTTVDGHGTGADTILAPEGNGGPYYAHRDVTSNTWQAGSTLSIEWTGWGRHVSKIGADALDTGFSGKQDTRAIDILREDGTLARRLSPTSSQLRFNGVDAAGFVQDRWLIAKRLMVETGVRADRDGVSRSTGLEPRAGAAFLLDPQGKATLRGGWGVFNERIPSAVGTFGQLAPRVDSLFGADGTSLTSAPVTYTYAIQGSLQAPRSRGWNISYEHRLTPWLSVRVNHLHRDGDHELVVDTHQAGSMGQITMSASGQSHYRDLEVGAHIARAKKIDIDVWYTHSTSTANLNSAYDYFLSRTADPIVRPDAVGPTDASMPNRLVMRGLVVVGRKWMIEMGGELSAGVPYSAVDAELNFAGVRNSLRFPTRAVLNVSVERQVRVMGLAPWVGLAVSNALKGFTSVDVQRNIASPAFGTFYNAAIRQVSLVLTFRR